MLLRGSCHCRTVTFSVESRHPYPYNRCYCSVCRKTAGSGGFAINLAGEAVSLDVEGRDDVQVYRAKTGDELSPLERHFCRSCGSMLWVWDPRWPELVHPFASAIDTALPVPPARSHVMLGSKAPWVVPDVGEDDTTFTAYPNESIAAWHERLGLTR